MGLRDWLKAMWGAPEPGGTPVHHGAPGHGGTAGRPRAGAVESGALELGRWKPPESTRRRGRAAEEIHFLGRGVSALLAERDSDIDALAAAGLPVMARAEDVAAAMEISVRELRGLAYHSPAEKRPHYVRFEVPKRGGGTRSLARPLPRLEACQRWILEHVLQPLRAHDAAHGFVPGRSTVTGARVHVGADLLVNMDLHDFFATIDWRRVRGMFRSLGYSPAVATVLALLCTEPPRREMVVEGTIYHAAIGERALPQGAPTSPAISNQVARHLDRRLSGLAARLQWRYTRYADDLAFSARGEPAGQLAYLLHRVRGIAREEGFAVNESKTRVQRPASRQTVTGLVVNDRVAVPRPTVRRLRAILHRARHEGLEAQNREGRAHFVAWLQGMIGYVEMANPRQGRALRAQLEAVQRSGQGRSG